ncbi:MAG: hypothetical protein ABL895_05310 [Cyclobacteriaceae bacterium]
MGLLSFLKSDKPTYTDKVWRTKTMAWRGMITEALKALTQNEIAIVFTFFDKTQTEIIDFLNQSNVPYFQLVPNQTSEAANQEKVFLCNVEVLQSTAMMGLISTWSAKTKVTFLFAGHYPLPSKEQLVIQRLNTSFPKSEIIFCSSLDNPSFKIFGSERIVDLLDKLGMKEDEAIEHAMVTKAMENARTKVESSVTHETKAESEEEWFVKNVKSGKP